MKHILLSRSLKYKKREKILDPKNFIYNPLLGLWIEESIEKPFILSVDFMAQATKKFDQETGEDNKGQ